MKQYHPTRKRRKISTSRRSRKRGGVEIVYLCPSRRNPKLDYTKSVDRCITEFEDNSGYTFIDVTPDGNCFFHTLELYFKLSHPGEPTYNYQDLRTITVQYMLEHHDKYSNMYAVSLNDITQLFEDGEWDNDAGDLVVAAASDALNLQLKVYDLQLGTRKPLTKKRIVLHTYPEEGVIPSETATLLRIHQGHYGLLTKSNINMLSDNMSSLRINNYNYTNKKNNKNNNNKNNKNKNKNKNNNS